MANVGGVTFDEIRSLDEGKLRALVANEDAVDRLFAIWELATRFGAEAIHERAHAGSGGEPSPGVRRHMCVVLAGGELDLLVALSRHDPDPGVRATASGLVARLAGGDRIPWEVVLERLETEAQGEVRREIVREIDLNQAPSKIEAAVRRRLAEDDDADVRLEAFTLLARRGDDAAFKFFAERLPLAPAPEAYALVRRWMDLVDNDASIIHTTLRRVNASVSARIIAAKELSTKWEWVAAAFTDPDPAVKQAVKDAFARRLDEVPLDAIVEWRDRPFEEVAALALMRRETEMSEETRAYLLSNAEERVAVVHAQLRERGIDPTKPFDRENSNDEGLWDLLDEQAGYEGIIETARRRDRG